MVIDLPTGLSHPPPPEPDDYRLQTSPLRGFIHHGNAADLAILKPGDPLELVAEPYNPHDRHAVRVHLHGRHLGYLPRESNHVVSHLLRQGAPLKAEVAWLCPQLNPHLPLTLHVLWPRELHQPGERS